MVEMVARITGESHRSAAEGTLAGRRILLPAVPSLKGRMLTHLAAGEIDFPRLRSWQPGDCAQMGGRKQCVSFA
jgi:hypothetical protein